MATTAADSFVDEQQPASTSLPSNGEEVPKASIPGGELPAPPISVSPAAAAVEESPARIEEGPQPTIHSEVKRLKAEQKALRAERMRVSHELKTAERKRAPESTCTEIDRCRSPGGYPSTTR